MASQLELFSESKTKYPTLSVIDQAAMSEAAHRNLAESGLDLLGVQNEEWTSDASTHALRYSTHGLFRFYGKFPPTVARHLISEWTGPGDTIFDPMVGSGTTAVEALHLSRKILSRDISPLSCLLTRVKTSRVDAIKAQESLSTILSLAAEKIASESHRPELWPDEIKCDHYFLAETSHRLHWLRESIGQIEEDDIRELLMVAFAAIIRRVSRATSQQGRLFLDVKTAEPDPLPRFESKALEAIERTAQLPNDGPPVIVQQEESTIENCKSLKFPLIICHPPYFNAYRYSRVFSLELAWLGFKRKPLVSQEIREFFKVGKPENVTKYLEDMTSFLHNISKTLDKKGVLALMVGDTRLRGERIQVTKRLIDGAKDWLTPFRVAVRTPRYTEASWVTSQRRGGAKLGVNILDFVILFQRKS